MRAESDTKSAVDGRANGLHSYEHHSIDEPAILLGGAFVVDAIEAEEQEKKEIEKKAQA